MTAARWEGSPWPAATATRKPPGSICVLLDALAIELRRVPPDERATIVRSVDLALVAFAGGSTTLADLVTALVDARARASRARGDGR